MEDVFSWIIMNTSSYFNFLNDYNDIVCGISLLLFCTALALLLFITFKKLRRKFPFRVNCWFCNNYTSISYEFLNGWDCPHCQQYNGFNKEGDYNKVIHEQYNNELNERKFKNFRTSVESPINNFQSNGFCRLCNINQQLKIQQLALFVPLNEDNYYEEIEQYREKLEKAYKLCSKCEKTLHDTLEQQQYNLLQKRLNNHKSNISQESNNSHKFNKKIILDFIKRNSVSAVKVVCVTLAVSLLIALIIQFETENNFLTFQRIDNSALEAILPILQVLLFIKEQVFYFKREVSFAGFLFSFVIYSNNQVKQNVLALVAWGLLHVSLWSVMTGFQVLCSSICLLLNTQVIEKKLIYFNKQPLIKKSGFQPVKKVFSEAYNNIKEEACSSHIIQPTLIKREVLDSLNETTDLGESKMNDGRVSDQNNVEAKEKKKRSQNEVELLQNEDTSESLNLDSVASCSYNNKASATESEQNLGELSGPFGEVHNTLNNLQLGGNKKKSKKARNFLFANHNFSEVKNTSSIIKPAKFIKNLNSNSWTESNECNSRSSTPSSGYSSQKPVKIETNHFDYPKSVSPMSVNPFSQHSPTNTFGYYDGNHVFYNNCFSQSLAPFHTYPGPMGHAAIYTYTRPTNFPFPLSPWQGFSGTKYTPSSPRFSDTSDSENLFQEASKSFEKSQKRFKFKSVFYYFSILLNFLTVVGLLYFTSAGIISVDWKLPKFDFFI